MPYTYDSGCEIEWDISLHGNDLNDGLENKQKDVESCRSSCRSMNANYFDFNYNSNKGCFCKDSNKGRRPTEGVISGGTKCSGNILISSISKNCVKRSSRNT